MEGENSFGGKLFENMSKIGDVTFLVGAEGEEEEIKSSVLVLRTFSSVFDTQFNENWKSQQDVVKLPDIESNMFRLFLKLLFTDSNKINISHLASPELSIEDILHLLYIANKYDVSSIQLICKASISSRMDLKNIVLIYETLKNMNELELEKKSFDFIITKFDQLLEEDSFVDFFIQSLEGFLKCEELSVRELPLFGGVCRWARFTLEKQEEQIENIGEGLRRVLGDLLFLIRFPLMSIGDFYKTVQPLGILTLEEIVSISKYLVQKGDPEFASVVPSFPFSTKERPNVSNEAPVVVKPGILENCFVYKPTQYTVVTMVKVGSSCQCRCNYSLKLCIFDGDDEILPLTSKGHLLCQDLTFTLETWPNFLPNKSYNIYYEVSKNGTPSLPHVSVNGGMLWFQT